MKLVFDSSSLIYFARSGILPVIAGLFGEKFVPPIVYYEVVTRGRAQGYPDAEITDDLIDKKLITIQKPDEQYQEKLHGLHRDLHAGELEVLALADELQGICILDDRIGRDIGEMFQIEVRGSAFILFTLVRNKIISREKAIHTLQIMIREGFRIGVLQYAAFLDLLEKIHKDESDS